MDLWIIDDGPLDQLAMALPSLELGAWPTGHFVVAEATRRDASGRRGELLEGNPDKFGTCQISIGSDAADVLYKHLRLPSNATVNEAEYQAIAWAMTEHQEAILVTLDKRAAMLALAELGRGRVAHAFDLWLHLRDNCLVAADGFADLCDRTRRNDQALPGIPLRCRA